jgi:RHS repeat-associated protein
VASAGADYRYGYNGMEEEDRGDAVSSEIASTGEKAKPGEANLLNTEFRLYDPRLGQWLTPDPVFQPWESPYSAMAGNPILYSDPQGLDETTSNGRVENGEVIVEVDRIPGAVTPLPSGNVSQYGKNEIRDLPSTVGKDGRNYTNVNGQEVRYVPYAGGETYGFEYSFTIDGVKMWKAFAPLSNGEANARRLRTRLNAIDDFRNFTTAVLLTPLVVAGAAEVVPFAVTSLVSRFGPYIPYIYNIASKPETKEFVVDLMLGDGPGVSNPFTPAGAGKVADDVAEGVAKTITEVEQYALRATEDGFYPVMKRGFQQPQGLVWLNKDEMWKFGTTVNPKTRYTQKYLEDIGVYYDSEFTGTLQEALQLENMKILNHEFQTGLLPAGNKIRK